MKCCHYSFFIKKSKQDYIKKGQRSKTKWGKNATKEKSIIFIFDKIFVNTDFI